MKNKQNKDNNNPKKLIFKKNKNNDKIVPFSTATLNL